MSNFPPDQDLAPEDRSLTTVVEARHSAAEARRILQGTREQCARLNGGNSCDVVLIAVPAGKGRSFVDGLGMALRAQGKLVDDSRWSGS